MSDGGDRTRLDAWAQTLLKTDLAARSPRATISAQTLARAHVREADAGARELALGATLGAAPGEAADGAQGWAPAPPLEALPLLDVVAADAPAEAAELALVGTLGEGGMGVVRRAWQRSLQREVAVKTLRDQTSTARFATKLLREAVLSGGLEHPNIVPVHALGRDAQGRPLLVMKRVEGESWATLLADPAHPAWRPREREDEGARLVRNLEILLAVCNAVAFAHSRGVVHRDIKPDNVMIGRFGEVYLLDWGVATGVVDASGALLGTPAYMAPEMAAVGGLGPITPLSDVYLLGATLFEVLTGAAPHQGESLYHVLCSAYERAWLDARGHGPEVLVEIVARATARDPQARFPDVEALRAALEAYLHHRSAIALTDAALIELAALEATLAAASTREPAALSLVDERALRERFTRCQTGLLAALRQWPGYGRAREGLQACVGAMIEHALRQALPGEAAALLAQLPEEDAALTARVEALARALRHQHDASRRLRALEREQDLGVGQRARTTLLISMIALGVGIGALILLGALSDPLRGGAAQVTHAQILGFIAAFAAVYSMGVWRWRRVLLSTAVNRRVIVTVGAAIGAMLIHRALGWGARAPVSWILTVDLLIEGALLMALAPGLGGPFLVTAATLALLGASAAALWPGAATLLFTLLGVVAPLVGLLGIWRAPRSPAPSDQDAP